MNQVPKESVKVEKTPQNRSHRNSLDFNDQKSQLFPLSKFLQNFNENAQYQLKDTFPHHLTKLKMSQSPKKSILKVLKLYS